MFTSLSVRLGITSRGTARHTVRGYPGYENWRFDIETCFREGTPEPAIVRAVPPDGSPAKLEGPSKHVLDRIVRLTASFGSDLDGAMALVAAASPDPIYHRDKDIRAAVTATLYEMEYERSFIERTLGRAFGDDRAFGKPHPRRAIGKTLGIPFEKTYNTEGQAIADESRPGKTVDNYIKLARERLRPTGETYLPEDAHRRFALEPEPVNRGPFAHHEITVFCWRTPCEGDIDIQPGERVVGPHVIVQARWTDPKRHIEDREDLKVIPRLDDVAPLTEWQQLQPIIQRLGSRYPGATVKACVTLESTPPESYPQD